MKKRIMAILLTLVMLCSLMPMGVFAASPIETVTGVCATCGENYINGICRSNHASIMQPVTDENGDGVYEISNAGWLQ